MRSFFIPLAAAAALIAVCAAGDNKVRLPKSSPVPSYGNADAISEEELKIYLYFLASDQLEGRNFPSRGYDTAALYIASHLAEWGLKPGGSTSGTNGPLQAYLLPIEMVAHTVVPEDSKLSLAGAGGGRGFGGGGGPGPGENAGPQIVEYEYGKQWLAGRMGGRSGGAVQSLNISSANLVFAGNGYVINKTKTNPYEGVDVKGRIIVVAGIPPELAPQQGGGRGGRGGRGGAAGQGAPEGQPNADAGPGRGGPNPLGEACTDFLTPEQYAAKNGALGVIIVAGFQQLATNAQFVGRGSLNGPPFVPAKFGSNAACPSAPALTAGVDLTNTLFQGEKINGSQAFIAATTNTKQESFSLNDRKKLSVHLAVKSEEGHGEDVVGIIEGSDPILKDEYVVMSAHLDHLGLSASTPDGHAVNNGADDDGSGSVGLLAVAHAYATGLAKGIRPKRSILFLWNGGEEKGLWGSQYFAEFPPIDLDKVVADLNMDMIGRTKNAKSVDPNQTHVLVNPGEVLVVGPNVSSDDLEKTLESVNDNYQKLNLNHFYDVTHPDDTHDNLGPTGRGQRVFYRSDHYNFAKMGIPIAFLTTGLHVDYHRPTDTPEKIDYKEMQIISKTLAAVSWELATQAGRPKLNDKLPDDLKKDMETVQKQGWGKMTPVLSPLKGMPF